MKINAPKFHRGSLVYTKQDNENPTRKKVYYISERYFKVLTFNLGINYVESNDSLSTLVQSEWDLIYGTAKYNSELLSERLKSVTSTNALFYSVFLPLSKETDIIGVATGRTIPVKTHELCLTFLIETIILDNKWPWQPGDKIWVLLEGSVNVF